MSETESSPFTGTRTVLVIGALLGLVSLSVWIGPWPPREIPKSLSKQLDEGHDAQLKSDWCRALGIFQELQGEYASYLKSNAALMDDVERNFQMLKGLCPKVPPEVGEVAVPQKEKPPEKIPEEELLKRYKKDKTIRSVGHFSIEGKGQNTAWGFRGKASFSYLSQVPIETRVVECDAKFGRLVFEQSFGDVVQLCAVSDQSLELVFPDSLPLRTFWPLAEGRLQQLSPGYRVLRSMAAALNLADPGLKRTLTGFSDVLRLNGIKLSNADKVEFLIQTEKLTDTKFRIVYLSGIGVTTIEQVGGQPKFSRDELIRLAHASTVMVDYFVFPSLKRREGETWEVRADEVGSLFALYDPAAEISGRVKLSREADEPEKGLAKFGLVGGTVEAHSNADGMTQEGKMTVSGGFALFDLTDYYVHRARVRFSAHSLGQSRDHLLFGTNQLRDLKVESRYEAEKVEVAEGVEPGK